MIDLGFRPRPHQREAHLLRRRFSVLVWHRRGGKTLWAVVELVLAALSCLHPDGSYGYIAPFLKQSKIVAWGYLCRFARLIPGTAISESELSVTLPNGATIRLYGADHPDSLRGIHWDLVVLDEVADMRPSVWGEIVRPALSDVGREGAAIFIGTPKGLNLFSDLYYRALGGEDDWWCDLRRAADTGAVSADELAKARREMSEAQYAQEYECDFGAAVDNAMIPLSDVVEAQRRVLVESQYNHAPRVLGVDVARYGDDATVLVPRQGLACFKARVLRGADTMEVASAVAQAIERWRPDAVFIDETGIGAGVVDRLRQLGHGVVGVAFGGKPNDARFANKRAEMWWGVKDWLAAGGALPDDPALLRDLVTPTYVHANATGRLQLESKESMRSRTSSSPDRGDALALTFAAHVAPKVKLLDGSVVERTHMVSEYDPYGGGARG